MNLGLIGRKVGMMRIFSDDGLAIPVTVLDMSNNRIAQIKSSDKDGYDAVQIAYGKRRVSRISKPLMGHYAKAGIEPGYCLNEFAVQPDEATTHNVGQSISVAIFSVGQKVDVTGTTKGKGFSGVIKRHNFSSNRASHGNSRSHNVPGSIGMAQDPGRVFPGKRMSGHLGDVQRTVQLLQIAKIDSMRQLLLVKGSVPGAKNSTVIVRPTTKARSS